MTFGTEGPMMSGTWYNPKNGDAFVVRDSFFEDNQYIVSTTDGRYLRYEQLQNYIQTDMKIEDLKKRKAENQVKSKPEIPAEVASILETPESNNYNDYLLPDEDVLTRGINTSSLGNLYESKPVMQTPSPATMNEAIIEKALKNAPKPEIKVDIFWDVYPEKQIEMLKDVMEISEDEIINWYLDNIDMMEVVDALKDAIRYRIRCKEGNPTQNKISDLVPETANLTYEQLVKEKEAKPKKTRKTTKNS